MPPAPVIRSVSTWQQPLPAAASANRTALLQRVAAYVLGRRAGRLRVAIDGFTAAGKTSFGHELAEHIAAAGRPVLRASLDDFKQPWRDRHRYDRESGEGYYRNAFDHAALHRLLLAPAAPGGSGICALCSIDPLTQIDQSGQITPMTEDAVLLVDGVFAFRPELDAAWDVRIWLQIAPELSVWRGTRRDSAREGAKAEALHRERYLVAERLYLQEAEPLARVDFLIDNSDFAEPRLLQSPA